MVKWLCLVFLPIVAWSKPIRIAVIDTGYSNNTSSKDVNLCPDGHADMIEGKMFLKQPPADLVPSKHGTNVAFLIDNQLGQQYKGEYCLVIIRYYGSKGQTDAPKKSNQAIAYAISIGVDFINYSGGGTNEMATETRLVKKALNKGIVFVAAAGNEGKNLDNSAFYPAMSDPRVVVVGNIHPNGERVRSSNYGKVVDMWETGYQVSGGGVTLTGTSQSTAIATGKLVKLKIDKQRKNVIEHMRSTASIKGRNDG
jgi:subtilisin family serine protease